MKTKTCSINSLAKQNTTSNCMMPVLYWDW